MNVEFVSRIIGLVLEGSRITSAMFTQDFADRNGERWLSLPEELGRRPQPPQLAQSLHSLERRGRASAEAASSELASIDWRRGLAKGNYLPGQVAYQGVVYDRKDMLMLHNKLLDKAHAAFANGPTRPAAEDITGIASSVDDDDAVHVAISEQPKANGGMSAGQGLTARGGGIHAISADEDLEDPKLPANLRRSSNSRYSSNPGSRQQRPGSQGQPQAQGSRGTMSGPLGETEPPPPRPPGTSPATVGATPPPGFSSDRGPGSEGGGSAYKDGNAPLRLPAIGKAAGTAAASAPPLRPKALTARG